MMLPVQTGPMSEVTFLLDVAHATELTAELRISSKPNNHTPDVVLARLRLPLKPGLNQAIPLRFNATIDAPRYAFVCLMANSAVTAQLSDQRIVGVLSVTQKFNRAVAKSPRQEPPPDSGIESFEFWIPQRRPGGKNLACRIDPPLHAFDVGNLLNGYARPTAQPNAWSATPDDENPALTLTWPEPVTMGSAELGFDTDFDHPLETVLIANPETVPPACIPQVRITDETGKVVAEVCDNFLSTVVVRFGSPVRTRQLTFTFTQPASGAPAALFRVSCY